MEAATRAAWSRCQTREETAEIIAMPTLYRRRGRPLRGGGYTRTPRRRAFQPLAAADPCRRVSHRRRELRALRAVLQVRPEGACVQLAQIAVEIPRRQLAGTVTRITMWVWREHGLAPFDVPIEPNVR